MKNIIMYAHSGSENHGCEAIVRSTCKMLKDNYKTILLSSAVKADKKYIGKFIQVRITKAMNWALRGELVEDK